LGASSHWSTQGKLCKNITLSAKLEVHNVSHNAIMAIRRGTRHEHRQHA